MTPAAPRVWNKRDKSVPGDAIYIGRPSKWGNPFAVGADGNREEVISKFRKWLLDHPELVRSAQQELAGKDLVCFCAPLPCHGDVLLQVANNLPEPVPSNVVTQIPLF